MATYKVIQDIEAEDKILGPLTLRQFIFGLITLFLLYLCVVVVKKNAAFLLILFLPPAIFTGFFTFPFGKDQPTEVWALAKINYYFKPRQRLWDQSGVKELVTITVPKRVERIYTNGLSQTEVKSRLSALASTIDTRGWAIKNVNVNMYNQTGQSAGSDSDRLVGMSSLPQAVPDSTVRPSDDMLDENNNPIAQQFTQMITASEKSHRQQLIQKMNAQTSQVVQPSLKPIADTWFTGRPNIQQPPAGPGPVAQVIEPMNTFAPAAAEPANPTPEEIALLEHIKAENDDPANNINSHMLTIQPLSAASSVPASVTGQSTTIVTPAPVPNPIPEPSITNQNLARSNDLNIATLAREAEKFNPRSGNLDDQGEVVVSLR